MVVFTRSRCRWGGLWAAANPQILSLTNFAGWRLAAISEKVDNTNLWPLRQTRKALMQPACLLESDWVNSTSYLRSPLLIQSSMTRSNCRLQSVSAKEECQPNRSHPSAASIWSSKDEHYEMQAYHTREQGKKKNTT